MSRALAELLAPIGVVRIAGDASECRVTSVTHDSRRVTAGAVFCCLPGARFDGREFASDAIARGAVSLLVDREISGLDPRFPQIVVDDVRRAMGRLAAAFWGNPSRDITVVGVTGTNGKTTTTQLLASIMDAAGWATDTIGTLGGGLTTPESTDLQERLATDRDRGVRGVAMEVSSHALLLHRVSGTWFATGVFTNLSQDHLDLHGDMESYFEAKATLFDREACGFGVVNVDDAYGRRLLDRDLPIVPFSVADLDDVNVTATCHSYTWERQSIRVPLGGSFNVANSLAAATVAREIGLPTEAIVEGLRRVRPVPGRLEIIDCGQDFTVVVDYAHTPDGLTNILRTLRETAPTARISVVFGCGGDRDRAKRPLMGEVAATLADEVVITSDNPRSEDPRAIVEAIAAGVPDHLRPRVSIEVDRAEAIRRALGRAGAGDVVVIAGKGHETTQSIGGVDRPFDDRVEVRRVLEGAS